VSYGSVSSIQNPQTGNPVRTLRTVAPWAGLGSQPYLGNGNTGWSLQTVTQSLGPADLNYVWNGTVPNAGYMRPYFTPNNSPYPHFFAWNDELRRLALKWQDEGFNYTYTDFRAMQVQNPVIPSCYVETNITDVYGTRMGSVFFGANDALQSPWIMAHEFGHLFQYNLQGQSPLYGGETHYVCQTLNSEASAFQEGFADWHASTWEIAGRYLYIPICYGGECQAACGTRSWRVEGNIHDFFWDVFDDSNHPTEDNNADPVKLPKSILKQWRSVCGQSGGCYTSFDHFYYDFLSKGAWLPYTTEILTLRNLDKVDQY
jgi:hypothetical protein